MRVSVYNILIPENS